MSFGDREFGKTFGLSFGQEVVGNTCAEAFLTPPLALSFLLCLALRLGASATTACTTEYSLSAMLSRQHMLGFTNDLQAAICKHATGLK